MKFAFFVRVSLAYLFSSRAGDGVKGLPLSQREAKGPCRTRGSGPVRLSPAPRAVREGEAFASCSSWLLVVGRLTYCTCGDEKILFSSYLGCPVFGPLNSIRKINYFSLVYLLGFQQLHTIPKCIFLVSNNDVTHYAVLQIILQLITSKMIKRSKVPKTTTSLSNK